MYHYCHSIITQYNTCRAWFLDIRLNTYINLLYHVIIPATCFGATSLTSTDGVSHYTAKWRGRGNRVEFELTSTVEGWVGIGFSHNRIMVIIFCHFY